jgi:hypothetical protein
MIRSRSLNKKDPVLQGPFSERGAPYYFKGYYFKGLFKVSEYSNSSSFFKSLTLYLI